MWIIVKRYKNQAKFNIHINKKVETIAYNSFDLFYCLKLILFNNCRGPPLPFNFKI